MDKVAEIKALLKQADTLFVESHLIHKRELNDGFQYRVGIKTGDADRPVLWLCDYVDIDGFAAFMHKRIDLKTFEVRRHIAATC
jgi:hypothetical protein